MNMFTVITKNSEIGRRLLESNFTIKSTKSKGFGNCDRSTKSCSEFWYRVFSSAGSVNIMYGEGSEISYRGPFSAVFTLALLSSNIFPPIILQNSLDTRVPFTRFPVSIV